MAYPIVHIPMIAEPIISMQGDLYGPDFRIYFHGQSDKIKATYDLLQNGMFAEHLSGLFKPSSGVPYLDIPVEPFEYTLQEDIEALPDIFQISSFLYVTPKGRGVLEGFEPDVHQYIPIRFLSPKDGRDYGPCFMVNICNRLEAYSDEHTNMQKLEKMHFVGPDIPQHFFVLVPLDMRFENLAVGFKSEVIAGRALWWEWRLRMPFMSDAFVAALKQARIEPGYAHNAYYAVEV